MAGLNEPTLGAQPGQPSAAPQAGQPRQVSEQDKALANEWRKRIEHVQGKDCV